MYHEEATASKVPQLVQCQLTCQLAKGGSFSPTSSFFRDRVIFRAATSTSSTRPLTFCPSLYFAFALSAPLSDMCIVGTNALQHNFSCPFQKRKRTLPN